MRFKNLSIIIPAFNEEERIGKTLSTILSYFRKNLNEFEIVVVDDGSSDRTTDVAKNFQKKNPEIKLLVNEKNQGKGFSVRRGALFSTKDYVLFSDADLSTPIEEIEKLSLFASENTIVIGSRGLKDSEILLHQPLYRELMGRCFNKIVQTLVLKGISDTQCGFKLFHRKAIEEIFPLLKLKGFSFDVELIYISMKKNFKIVEVPVRWINDRQSKVHPVKDSLKMLLEIFKIRMIHG